MKKVTLTSQARKVFRGSSRGFTLVEVLITIALIGAIAVAFFSFMSAATSALIHADERTIAESLARSQMEYVKNQGYINATSPTWQVTYQRLPGIPIGYSICSIDWTTNQTSNCGATPNMSIVAIALNSTTSDSGLQRIKLVIKHDDKEVVTLEGYKRSK